MSIPEKTDEETVYFCAKCFKKIKIKNVHRLPETKIEEQ